MLLWDFWVSKEIPYTHASLFSLQFYQIYFNQKENISTFILFFSCSFSLVLLFCSVLRPSWPQTQRSTCVCLMHVGLKVCTALVILSYTSVSPLPSLPAMFHTEHHEWPTGCSVSFWEFWLHPYPAIGVLGSWPHPALHVFWGLNSGLHPCTQWAISPQSFWFFVVAVVYFGFFVCLFGAGN